MQYTKNPATINPTLGTSSENPSEIKLENDHRVLQCNARRILQRLHVDTNQD